MKQYFGMSQNGDLKEAARGIRTPQLIMLFSNGEQFEAHVRQLEELFPGVPSIGCIGMSYGSRIVEKGVGVLSFSEGVSAAANVLEEVSAMPVKYIERLEQDVKSVGGSQENTICIDFCAGNDACVLTQYAPHIQSFFVLYHNSQNFNRCEKGRNTLIALRPNFNSMRIL